MRIRQGGTPTKMKQARNSLYPVVAAADNDDDNDGDDDDIMVITQVHTCNVSNIPYPKQAKHALHSYIHVCNMCNIPKCLPLGCRSEGMFLQQRVVAITPIYRD